MLHYILTKIGLADGVITVSSDVATKRRHTRHAGDHAEVRLNGRVFGVRDWSLGGVFIEVPDDVDVSVGSDIEIDLTFRIPHETVSVRHVGKVVRAVQRGVAAEFAPLTAELRNKMESVIDRLYAEPQLSRQRA